MYRYGYQYPYYGGTMYQAPAAGAGQQGQMMMPEHQMEDMDMKTMMKKHMQMTQDTHRMVKDMYEQMQNMQMMMKK